MNTTKEASDLAAVSRTQDHVDAEPLSPEEIKAIGEIELGPSKHEIFLNKHYKKLLWGGIALGIAAGCVIAYFSHRNDMKQSAAAEVVQAMGITSPDAAVNPADFNTQALGELSSTYAATPSAATGRLLAGMRELSGGDAAKGVAALEQLAAESEDVLIKSRALCAIASYRMTNGEDDAAATAWEKVAALGDTPYTALAYLTLGDLARSKGDTEKARDYYAQAESKCPTSPLVTGKTVQMHLMLLDVDAPKPVEPAPAAAPNGSSATPLDNPLDAPAPADSGKPASSELDNLMSTPAGQGEAPVTPGL